MNIRHYAAHSCGGADWTQAFLCAIDDLRAQGGGVLTVPAGVYPTGSIRLYDNMTLVVEAGATLRFHQDENAFPIIMGEYEREYLPLIDQFNREIRKESERLLTYRYFESTRLAQALVELVRQAQ